MQRPNHLHVNVCSTTSTGQEHEMMKFVSRIPRTLDVSRSWRRREVGTFLHTPEGKWDPTATQIVERLKDTSHPVFKSFSPLSRRILKKRNNRDTIHFNADASNIELLFRSIHSVDQLSISGAVSNFCKQFVLTEEERGIRKTSGKERIRDQRCIVKCEFSRSKTFGIFSKTSTWKQFAEKHSGLRSNPCLR